MDTRRKIVDQAQAAGIAAAGATVVSGYFDPLIAAHGARLESIKNGGAKLLVLIATPENAILPAAARAELVAGLHCVDHVAELGSGIAAQIHLEQEDDGRFAALLEHVHARQKGAS
jgi:hypothetical protein